MALTNIAPVEVIAFQIQLKQIKIPLSLFLRTSPAQNLQFPIGCRDFFYPKKLQLSIH